MDTQKKIEVIKAQIRSIQSAAEYSRGILAAGPPYGHTRTYRDEYHEIGEFVTISQAQYQRDLDYEEIIIPILQRALDGLGALQEIADEAPDTRPVWTDDSELTDDAPALAWNHPGNGTGLGW